MLVSCASISSLLDYIKFFETGLFYFLDFFASFVASGSRLLLREFADSGATGGFSLKDSQYIRATSSKIRFRR